ncbi:VWA domain-containing protein [Rhodopirellula sp. MGV]|uniref:VWA domain-containing protein n=1 Tax=Rhodopirellula sp. MGV TaxID=2023130 RepID=UPI0013045128|nr:VWA domain-containing protein [Rhodopirellula sp. MGV]
MQQLTGRHDNARVMAIHSIGQDYQHRIEALPTVIAALNKLKEDPRFKRSLDPDSPEILDGIVQMIQFVGRVDVPESTDVLCSVLEMPNFTWVLAAAQTLGHHQHHRAIDRLAKLIDSEHFKASYGFRFTLARSLIEMNHPDGWETLATLALSVDGQLAYLLEQECDRVTIDDFLGDQERYSAWRKSLGLDREPGQVSPAPRDLQSGTNALAKVLQNLQSNRQVAESEVEPTTDAGRPKLANTAPSADSLPKPTKMSLAADTTAATYLREKRLHPSHYYGMEIYAKRLLFVLDRSGSMNALVYGQTRMQRAQRELISAIEGLDEECEFGILVFDTSVHQWRSELVKADKKQKMEAIRYVSNLVSGNRTNTYAALRESLEFDAQVEAVFILTDGQPTIGQLVNPSAILLDILRRNEFHNISINTIAIAVEPVMETFLRRLAEPSQGECRVVD